MSIREQRRSRPDPLGDDEEQVYDPVARDRARSAQTAGERAEERAEVAISIAQGASDKIDGVLEVLGRAPAPGLPGSGLVGAVSEMQADLRRLLASEDARRRAAEPARRASKTTALVALVATLLGGGGITALVQALRGAGPTQQPDTERRAAEAERTHSLR